MRVCAISVIALLLSIWCTALADETTEVSQFRTAIEALGGGDEGARDRALERLQPGVDQLFDVSMHPEEKFKWGPLQDATVAELDRLVSMLDSPKPQITETAASLIGLIDRQGERAIPALTRLVQNESADAGTRMTAGLALARVLPADKPIGPILLPIVRRAKIDEDDGPDPEFASEKLAPKKRENRGKLGMSWSSLQSVGLSVGMYSMMFGGTDRTLVEVPSLVEATSSKYPKIVRLIAIGILGEFEFDARGAVGALRELLADEDRAVRGYALLALVQIEDDPEFAKSRLKDSKLTGEDASDVQERIDDWFESSNAEREKRRTLFSDPGDLEDGTLSMVIELARGPHGFHRRSSVCTFGKLGRFAKPALPTLRELLKHPDEATRQIAAEAIRKIESDR